MKVKFVLENKELRELISDYFREKTGQEVLPEFISIKVKSKQNYKSEWESADFKAEYEGDI